MDKIIKGSAAPRKPFNYEIHGHIMDNKSVEALKEAFDYPDSIPLSRDDIYRIAVAMKNWDRDKFKDYIPQLKAYFKSIKDFTETVTIPARTHRERHEKRFIEKGQLIEKVWFTEFVTPEHERTVSEPGLMLIPVGAFARGCIVMALELGGRQKEDFQLMHRFIKWYGIERKQARIFKDYIPQDTRPGHYDNEYDGSKREEYSIDHQAIKDDLKFTEIIRSAVENNAWSLDKVSP
jgi:hypothetical protein